MSLYVVAGIISGILQTTSAIPYFRSILKGTTKPNIVSYSLWTTIQIIAIAAQINSGWSWSIVILLASTINTAISVALCLKGYGYKHYGWTDWVCLIGAIVTLGAWGITKEPLTALILAAFTNIFSSLPTIIKVIKYPETENALAWLMTSVASVFSILSVTNINISNLIFPIEFLIESAIIGGIALWGRQLLMRRN